MALRNAHAVLAEDGFLLMYEGTSTGPACVWGLDARVWDFADRRDYAAWMSLATWQARLSAAGFRVVASHRRALRSVPVGRCSGLRGDEGLGCAWWAHLVLLLSPPDAS